MEAKTKGVRRTPSVGGWEVNKQGGEHPKEKGPPDVRLKSSLN